MKQSQPSQSQPRQARTTASQSADAWKKKCLFLYASERLLVVNTIMVLTDIFSKGVKNKCKKQNSRT